MGFEPIISADERPQTYALDRAATETGISDFGVMKSKGMQCNVQETRKICQKFQFEDLKEGEQLENLDIDGDNINLLAPELFF